MDPAERRSWDRDGVADRIDDLWRTSPYEEAHRDTLAALCARYLSEGRRLSVLEVGCGTARIHQRLVPALLPESGWLGIDSSQRMLQLARRRRPGARLVRGDGSALPLRDRSFDYALAFEVLGHLRSVLPLLRELGRVARRGFVFTVWPAAEEEGVVDEREMVDGVEFPHRRFATSWLVRQVADALPGVPLDLEIAPLHGDVWAYVVLRRDSGPPGVAEPRLVPVGGFGDRLLRHAESARSQP